MVQSNNPPPPPGWGENEYNYFEDTKLSKDSEPLIIII